MNVGVIFTASVAFLLYRHVSYTSSRNGTRTSYAANASLTRTQQNASHNPARSNRHHPQQPHKEPAPQPQSYRSTCSFILPRPSRLWAEETFFLSVFTLFSAAHPFLLQQVNNQLVHYFLSQQSNILFLFLSELMDLFVAGWDQSAADQSNRFTGHSISAAEQRFKANSRHARSPVANINWYSLGALSFRKVTSML